MEGKKDLVINYGATMALGGKGEELETNIEDGLVELIYIDPSGKQINITEEIPVEVEPISRLDSIEIFKDSLYINDSRTKEYHRIPTKRTT